MLDWFHGFCKEHSIRYYLVAGTMLGAARHQGFIPWDDDVDVAIPRPDYERLLSILKDKQGHYFLESLYTGNDDYLCTYAKLYDTDTTRIECAKINCKRGIYIDVFPIDGVGSCEMDAKKNFAKFDRLHMLFLTRVCAIKKGRSFYKNVAIAISRLVPQFVIRDRDLAIKVDKLAASIDYESCDFVANKMGAYREREIMKKSIFGKPTEYKFENITVYGVEHFDEYLTIMYGDWRKLPPENQRHTTHDYIELNLDKSYLEP